MAELHHRASAGFWQLYQSLSHDVQQRADKQFALLSAAPEHPSLHFKKIGTRQGHEIWSARVTQTYRALAIKEAVGFLWFWIGDHKTYDRLLA